MDVAAAYADNWSDRALLGHVGRAVVVHPHRKLKRLAEQQGWIIVRPRRPRRAVDPRRGTLNPERPGDNAGAVVLLCSRMTLSGPIELCAIRAVRELTAMPLIPSTLRKASEADVPAPWRLVMGLAALTAQASESELVHDIQRYCAVCWRNARLDPGIWDDCTQEVCCRLLGKARAGVLDLNLVLAEDTAERRELVRAIDMVRKRVQRARRHQSFDEQLAPGSDQDRATASVRSWARSSRPPEGPSCPPDRTGSSSSGPGAGTSPTSAIDGPLPRPRQRREVQGAPQARASPGRPPR